ANGSFLLKLIKSAIVFFYSIFLSRIQPRESFIHVCIIVSFAKESALSMQFVGFVLFCKVSG
ncbi:MAG: hypothetical protein J5605_03930, partial [Bacteroidales bacterium]|nr:hypothetical protein [Bacteroidales bacterium]